MSAPAGSSPAPVDPGKLTPEALLQRYQRLAQEYAKVKQQNGVLKKAVVNEQNNYLEAKAALQLKEEAARTAIEQVDQLTFHNQQLSRRVELLQEEREKKTPSMSKRQSTLKANETLEAATGELEAKIRENEALHSRIFEQKRQQEHQLADIEREMANQKHLLVSRESDLKALREKHQTLEERCKGEVAALTQALQTAKADAGASRSELELLQEQLGRCKEELARVKDRAKTTMSRKLRFDDTEIGAFNALNVPSFDSRRLRKTNLVVTQARALVSEFSDSLRAYHTAYVERVSVFPNATPSFAVRKLQSLLDTLQAPILDAVRHSCDSQVDTSGSDKPASPRSPSECLAAFASAFARLIGNTDTSLPYHLLVLQDEIDNPSCTPTLRARNVLLIESMRTTQVNMRLAHDYFRAAIAVSNGVTSTADSVGSADAGAGATQANARAVLGRLATAIERLQVSLRTFSAQFASKTSQELTLPTTPQSLRAINERVIGSLASLTACVGKAATFLREHILFLSTSSSSCTSGGASVPVDTSTAPLSSDASVSRLSRRALAFVASLRARPLQPTVPYEIAIANRSSAQSSVTTSESLQEKVALMRKQISKIEQEREKWMLECQLLQNRSAKERLRTEGAGGVGGGRGASPVRGGERVRELEMEVEKWKREKEKAVAEAEQVRRECDETMRKVQRQKQRDEQQSKIVTETAAQSGIVLSSGGEADDGTDVNDASDENAVTAEAPVVVASASASVDSNPDKENDSDELRVREGERGTLVSVLSSTGELHKSKLPMVPLPAEEANREDLIREHFTSRISQLTKDLQVADSKAVAHHLECRALAKRCDALDQMKVRWERDAEQHRRDVARLRDELATTSRSYGDQIQLMTEHIATADEEHKRAMAAQAERFRQHMHQQQQGAAASPQKKSSGGLLSRKK